MYPSFLPHFAPMRTPFRMGATLLKKKGPVAKCMNCTKTAFPLGGRWPEGPDEGATPGNFRSIAPSSVAPRQLPPKGKPFAAYLCNFTIWQQALAAERPTEWFSLLVSDNSSTPAAGTQKENGSRCILLSYLILPPCGRHSAWGRLF